MADVVHHSDFEDGNRLAAVERIRQSLWGVRLTKAESEELIRAIRVRTLKD